MLFNGFKIWIFKLWHFQPFDFKFISTDFNAHHYSQNVIFSPNLIVCNSINFNLHEMQLVLHNLYSISRKQFNLHPAPYPHLNSPIEATESNFNLILMSFERPSPLLFVCSH